MTKIYISVCIILYLTGCAGQTYFLPRATPVRIDVLVWDKDTPMYRVIASDTWIKNVGKIKFPKLGDAKPFFYYRVFPQEELEAIIKDAFVPGFQNIPDFKDDITELIKQGKYPCLIEIRSGAYHKKVCSLNVGNYADAFHRALIRLLAIEVTLADEDRLPLPIPGD